MPKSTHRAYCQITLTLALATGFPSTPAFADPPAQQSIHFRDLHREGKMQLGVSQEWH